MNTDSVNDENKRLFSFLKADGEQTKPNAVEASTPSLPNGGGAIKGIDEKFSVNAVNGSTTFSVPLPFSPTRGVSPALSLSYNSGNGNGIFGLGWNISLASIKRKTDNQLPRYADAIDSDTFLLSDAEDLIPEFKKKPDGSFEKDSQGEYIINERDSADGTFTIRNYRPRSEGLFARIERWTKKGGNEIKWRVTTGENVTTLFGWSADSRLEAPGNASKIFQWLPEFVFDDKGNCCRYFYKKEDGTGLDPSQLHNRNRIKGGRITYTNIYPDKLCYGNKTPYRGFDHPFPKEDDYLFQTVFDYGLLGINDAVDTRNAWDARPDAFSNYKAGFEVRTTRLCNRVLLYHVFDELAVKPDQSDKKTLVKSLNFEYDISGEQDFTFLKNIVSYGYIKNEDGTYSHKKLPPLAFDYQKHHWNKQVKTIQAEDLVHAPSGISTRKHQFVDLFNEGLNGILTEQGNAWFYKHNLGEGRFSEAKRLTSKPAVRGLGQQFHLADLAANGSKQLVSYDAAGYYELTDDNEWQPFRFFESLPNIDFGNTHIRLLDLNGDGKPDVVITEDDTLVWYASQGKGGYAAAQKSWQSMNEEEGPRILFADSRQSIFLADMSGDGLTDIVRIRNGEVCYWPNLGYGKFGAKVSLGNAPVFDHPDAFNPSYLKLADIDGSGTTDIIYLGKNKLTCWKNLSGNSFHPAPFEISNFPEVHHQAAIDVIDLLGNGVACIVWSSPLQKDAAAPLKYIDLMDSKKPHIMVSYKNNMGKEVTCEYTPSTRFYIEDKKAGKPWITKLHFPVHCVSRVRIEDKIRQTVFSSSYSYHHGYYDHTEKEFRGFARIEQLDTETFEQFGLNDARNVVEKDLHQPPVKTIKWFHTGAFSRSEKILHQCRNEYFDHDAMTEYNAPELTIPSALTAKEMQEAFSACKGTALRTEIYALDGTDKSEFPYAVSQAYTEVKLVQPTGKNKYACFLIIPSESVSYSYERDPTDPRISQSFILETDELGNPTKSAAVIYPRISRPTGAGSIPDQVWEEQRKLYIDYGETTYSNDVVATDKYRLRLPIESKAFEVSGINQPPNFFFSKEEIRAAIASTGTILFEEDFDNSPQKRLISHTRTYFYDDHLSASLPLGQISFLAIPYKTFQLAFTKDLATQFYGTKVSPPMLEHARYVHCEGDEHWWIHSGEKIFPQNPKDSFYVPVGDRDIFGAESFLEFDRYHLLVNKTTNAIGNSSTVINDYRILSPVLLTDPNLNRAAIKTDELGFVVSVAVMGKEGDDEGDTLADPTTRITYDLRNWADNQRPNYVHTFTREQHGAANPRWQESYAYSDGSGNVIVTKSQVEPGIAKRWNSATKQLEEVQTDHRWICNGRTIINNKGLPVKAYEPYFSATPEFEDEAALVESGVTAITYFDPIGRNIKTAFPNGTFSKKEFDAWRAKSFDVNDTVMDSNWYIERGSPDPAGPEPTDPETRAAWLAAQHDNTPEILFLDGLERGVYVKTYVSKDTTTATFSESDPSRRFTKLYDQKGRLVSESYTNLLGETIYSWTIEKGKRWVLNDAGGRVVKIWDNDDWELRSSFDTLHRPVSAYVTQHGLETMFSHVIYGDTLPDAASRNLHGQVYQMYDQSGVTTTEEIDFKSNILRAAQKITKEYKQQTDWRILEGLTDINEVKEAAKTLLEEESFTSTTVLDALNRPTSVTLPDGSVVVPEYNEANYLKTLRVKIRGADTFTTFLSNQRYDAKGQRQFAEYGNGTITKYFYDPLNFRLINLITRKDNPDSGAFQDLTYYFDPIGNITQARDDAQQTHFFSNTVIYPEYKFEYDAIYQLTKAIGREHISAGGGLPYNHNDLPFINQLPHSNDLNALRQYTEQYSYDELGNIKRIQHTAGQIKWVRDYQYEYQDTPLITSNRLIATSRPGDNPHSFSDNYAYDLRGNITSLPHLPGPNSLKWNFMDQLKEVNLGGGGMAFYVYDASGNRSRKIIERNGGKRIERIYLGAVEIYRERQGNTSPNFERYTLHISDNIGRIAQIDTKTVDKNNNDPVNQLNENTIRYQYGNHLGSVTLETDHTGNLIAYEEYHPFGTTAYRISRPDSNLSLKRYRFSGKERDDETGLYYFGARYYAAWLGRWISSDPGGLVDGFNLFKYCSNNPIMFHDPNGMNDVVVRSPELGRDASWDTLRRHVPEGYQIRSDINEGNYEEKWTDESGGFWDILELAPVDSGSGAGDTAGSADTTSPPVSEGAPPSSSDPDPAPADSSAPSGGGGAPERTFWNRGGSALVGGAVLLGAGLLTIFTAGAATPVLVLAAGTMATAGGIAVTTASSVQLAASYSGQTTAAQDRQTVEGLHLVSSLSSPMGLSAGAIGAMTADDPEAGLRTGALIGNVAEGAIGIGIAVTAFNNSRNAAGAYNLITNDPNLLRQTVTMPPTVPSGTYVISSHGTSGMMEIGSRLAPISELRPMMLAQPHGDVLLLACNVAHNPSAVQSLANTTGRNIDAYTNFVGAFHYNQIVAFAGHYTGAPGAVTGLATPTTFTPNIFSRIAFGGAPVFVPAAAGANAIE